MNTIIVPDAVPGQPDADRSSTLKRDHAIAALAIHKELTLQEAADEIQKILDDLSSVVDALVREQE